MQRGWLAVGFWGWMALGLGCGAPGVGDDTSDVVDREPLAGEHKLAQRDLQPEGLAFDEVTRSFFAGSLTRGTVTRIDELGGERIVLDTEGATLGMEADAASRTLWVCSILDGGGNPGTVHQIDLDTLELVKRYPLSDAFATASCNDITVDDDGTAYVTDRENPHIYRIDPATQTATLWLAHKELEPGLVGMNGIVIDGDTMIVTKYLAPKLYAIPMADPEAVRRIDLDGDWLHVVFHPLAGADGIELFGGDLYLAFDAAAFRIRATSDDWSTADVEQLDGIDTHGGLTAIVAAEGALYGSNGQAPKYVLGAKPKDARIWRLQD